MPNSINKPIASMSVEEAAAELVRMINSRPVSPRAEEIAAVIAKAVATSAPLLELSPAHLEFRKIVAEIARFEEDGYPPGMTPEESEAALNALSDQAMAIERTIWARPAQTLADVLLRGEMALYNENGVMDFLDVADAYEDDRANAQLIRAVVDVLGGLYAR